MSAVDATEPVSVFARYEVFSAPGTSLFGLSVHYPIVRLMYERSGCVLQLGSVLIICVLLIAIAGSLPSRSANVGAALAFKPIAHSEHTDHSGDCAYA